ncbi:MAG: class I SAM-dependent methyltransferase [Candidatus Hydrogenedentes bacterium]|nr:class I SAM-dependent methyltransferase [Candidatus Hydrogenedentota bacterium]
MPHTTVDEDWYASAFDALYPVVYAHRTVEAATDESAFAIDQLRLCTTCSVLDLCCGNGRHMVHLLKHTPHVTGLDYSPSLLHLARGLLAGEGFLVRADMRAIPFAGAFDAVANFFTSFGYFTRDEENQAVARGIASALKPGGRFFMDYLNPAHVTANLEPESRRRAEDLEIIERRWIDPATRRVNKAMRVLRDGHTLSETSESVRLYSPDELVRLLGQAGLHVEALYGDYGGHPAGDDRPRLIAVGTRS